MIFSFRRRTLNAFSFLGDANNCYRGGSRHKGGSHHEEGTGCLGMKEEYEVSFPRRSEGKHKPWFLSKKVWMTLLAAIIPIFNNRFGWGLETEELAAAIAAIIVYVAAEAGTDMAHGKGK